jgi:TRAP-type C4-dicarboxylate transport system substrate-binding protein
VAAIVIAGMTAASGMAETRELSYSTGYPAGTPAAVAADMYADLLEDYSDGSLAAKIFDTGSLLSFAETSMGIRDGMADSGLVFVSYFPAEYRSTNLVSELTMLLELTDVPVDKAGVAYVGAMSEYVFHHCPECVDEFASQNQVYLGGGGSPPYLLLCNQPVRSQDELEGKRLRAPGAQWSRWAESMGATPVFMSASETYEGLDQGVIDCSMTVAAELSVWNLTEVVTDITTGVPGGVYGAAAANNVNAEVWRSLDDNDKRALLHASATLSAQATWIYTTEDREELAKARDSADIQVHESEQALVQATRSFVTDDIEKVADTYRDKHGIERSEEMIASFRPILEKWVELVQDADNGDELAQLYWDETFSKVDVSSYGM